jgi:hypothetical protein
MSERGMRELVAIGKMEEVFKIGNIVTLRCPNTIGYLQYEGERIFTGLVFDSGIITTTGRIYWFNHDIEKLTQNEYGCTIPYSVIEAVSFLLNDTKNNKFSNMCSIASWTRALSIGIETAHDAGKLMDYKKIEL